MTSELIDLLNDVRFRLENIGSSKETDDNLVDRIISAVGNMRAVPDVPELVRYAISNNGGRYFGMAETLGGEYVLHSQAAEQLLISKNLSALQSETIALLDKDVSDLRNRASPAADLRAERDRYRLALEFYADTSKYPAPLTGGMGDLWSDCGQIARAALNVETSNDKA